MGRGNATRASAVIAAAIAAALSVSLVMMPRARAADDKPIVMKIALATLDDVLHQYVKNFAAAVEKDSAGRIKAEIYPASQLGSIQRQAEGVQFGAIQCQVVAPEFLVGIDERFEVLAAPGLVTSMAQGQRVAADPAVRQLMLGLGADKGLHGAALLMSTPSSVIAKVPIRHLADFKGKKVRIFASQFESVALTRLGAIAKPMTLAEVLPALHDNSIDGAVSGITIFGPLHFESAAKYVTEIGQPAIFGVVELSKKWYDALPADLQQILDKDATAESVAINPQAVTINDNARKAWLANGGELISLPDDEQSSLLKIVAGVGDEVSNAKPELSAAYKVVTEAAQRVH
ncbi:MAG TPA: TRAP transporter substrate-binding protein [Xanthobacteraceae bacterium]|nr:TRAP transporter substrate-binding protein [Xanthobacteraceae bacterium]